MGPGGRLIRFAVLGVAAIALQAQDHVGKPVPEFTTGDECLFCHRTKVADTWQQNPHARTIHPADNDPEKQILGARTRHRELKPAGYGKFALLEDAAWNETRFADRCAGCHSTAVDPGTRAFATASLDCYSCHGVADLNHTKDKSLMWLSSQHAKDPKLIASICAQCHLRGGKSRATGRPYPTNFVAGDDLFLDFQVDLKQADNAELNAGDRHVYRNVRDVLENGSEVTCINCHQVHGDSSQKHRRVLTGPICVDCHNETGPKKAVKTYAVHSATCEY